MIHYCGVVNFLTEFTDQLHGSKEFAFHLIKAETYENYGLLLVNLYQVLNLQPWPIYIFIPHADFRSLFFPISTPDADKGQRVWGLPLVRTLAKCTTQSGEGAPRSHWRGTERKQDVCVGANGHSRRRRRHWVRFWKSELRWSSPWNKTSGSSSCSLHNVIRHERLSSE